jgi:peptidyl-prolyl cis-trans isomerase C
MRKGLTFLAPLAMVAVLGLPGVLYADPSAETVIARVNGEEITLGHLIVARATLPEQYQQLPSDVLFGAILDQLVQQTALKQSLSTELPAYVELSLENERRSLVAAEVIEGVMMGAAGDAAVQAAYDEKYGDGFGEVEFNASHILVETEEEAADLIIQIDEGADFAELAKEKSTGPSGPSGGSLGWFGGGRMVAEFETAVAALDPGQVSPPVQTQFGWHVIILNERRQAEAPELDAVRAELEGELREKAVAARIKELVDAAEVERPEIEDLDPEILQDIDLVRN